MVVEQKFLGIHHFSFSPLYISELKKWALLPVHVPNAKSSTPASQSTTPTTPLKFDSLERDSTQHYLVPLGMANTVIDFKHVSVDPRFCLHQ